ncbi:MAG: hypothetical protein H6624_15530 [Bdellovibrionaceae bacterium]|nr:hypothetical protein [Pseudobdellovibrionaceae bacterium]
MVYLRYVILLLAALLLAAGMVNHLGKSMNDQNKNLRMGFPLVEEVYNLDPLKIHLAPQYALLENLYSRLVLNSPEKGEPEAAIAKRYFWKENQLHFEIRDDLSTVDGHKITAQDAAFSLKRYLILKGGTHSDFASLVCGDKNLRSTEDHCNGIEAIGNTLILKPATKDAYFLVPMLTEMDFAIIPQVSVDPKTLKIIDYRNTSGPFYVDKDKSGQPVLKPNKNHFLYHQNMPQEVSLVKTNSGGETAIKLFQQNKIDYISAADSTRPDEIISFASTAKANLHQTVNIRTFVLVFTKKGTKHINKGQRIAIGKTLKSIMVKHFSNRPGYEISEQFFPSFGDGSLSKSDVVGLKKLFESTTKSKSGKGLTLSFVRFGEYSTIEQKIKEELPGIQIREEKNAPAFLDYPSENDMPDMFICGPDTAFKEDIGLLTYSLEAGLLRSKEGDASKWLHDYMKISGKGERLEKLKSLHKETLMQGFMVPLLSAPYVSLARPPWKINFTQLYASNHLWLLNLQ